jgi:hypothetical protein
VALARAYALGLRLFPADYRAALADQMLRTFDEAACDLGRMRAPAAVRFVAREFVSLFRAIGEEWFVKLTSDAAARGRCLPDCRMMRPPGVTREQWSAGLDAIGGRFGW